MIETRTKYRRAIDTCYQAACSYAKSGEVEAAFEALAECFELGDLDVERWQLDPELDSLREDERFEGLIDLMKRRSARVASRQLQ
jgi:hypothetical protein